MKGVQEKYSIMGERGRQKNPSLTITVLHHSASLGLPNSDPRDGFFYLPLSPMIGPFCNRKEVMSPMLPTWADKEMSYILRKRTCVPNEDSTQPAHPHSLTSLHCPHEETVHPWLFKMLLLKILIRLRERAGWPESSLGARWYIFWRWAQIASIVFSLFCRTCFSMGNLSVQVHTFFRPCTYIHPDDHQSVHPK